MDNPYPICENCIFVDEPLDKDPCQECNRAFLAMRIKPNFVSKRKPKTNYDRIISKTPEELAKFIEFVSAGCDYMSPDCPAHDSCKRVCDQNDACGKGWLDWLRQEAAE